MKWSSLTMLIYDLDVKACGLMIGLLSVCEVMGLYMYIALVDSDWGHELGLIRLYLYARHGSICYLL